MNVWCCIVLQKYHVSMFFFSTHKPFGFQLEKLRSISIVCVDKILVVQSPQNEIDENMQKKKCNVI